MLAKILRQMVTVVKAGEHPGGKKAERGKCDRAARGDVQSEPVNMGKIETKGGTDYSADRHSVAHDGYRAVQRTLAQTVNHWPGSLLQGSQGLSFWWSRSSRILKPALKISPMIAQ